MSIRFKIFVAFFVLVAPLILINFLMLRQLQAVAVPINEDIPKSVDQLAAASKLDSNAQFIRYYDEVLTQGARNFAFTRDIKWKNVYDQTAPKLDTIIKEAIVFGDEQDKKFFEEVDAANLALVEMEMAAINLVSKNKDKEAIKILESEKYWQQKEIYKSGLVKYLERRGRQYYQAMTASTETLNAASSKTKTLIDSSTQITTAIIIIYVILSLFFGLLIPYFITRPLVVFQKTVKEITRGNLQERLDISSNDEIGQLAKSFNEMTNNLQQAQTNIEEKVVQRTAELERVNKLMIDRELKMIELKKQLKQMHDQN